VSQFSKTSRDLHALTIARFFAALGVVWYHFARTAIVPYRAALRGLVGSGHAGVTFFFVLSGFILTYVYYKRDMGTQLELRNYIAHRVARIYPVYMLAWAFFGSVALLIGYRLVGFVGWGGLAALLVQAWIPSAAHHWNWPGWSLSAEMFFYACFPTLLIWSGRMSTRHLWLSLIALSLANAAHIELIYRFGDDLIARGTPFEDSVTSYLSRLPLLVLPLFAMGVVLARSFVRMEVRPVTPPWLLATIVVIVLATLSVYADAAVTRYRDFLLAPEFCVLIFALACTRVDGRGLVTRASIALGKASYALYIIQMPLWIAWQLVLKETGETHSILEVLLFSVLAIALSLAIYELVERPAERFIRARYSGKLPEVSGLAPAKLLQQP
jgi:peptidoglycan/LPS O-acetylase OafA/YrhL